MGIFVLIWVACAAFAYFVAERRAPSKAGIAALLGFALGPIGVIAAFMMKDEDSGSE